MKENKKIWLCNKTDGKDKTDVLILLFWLKSDIKFDIKYWFDQLIKTSADSNETIWLKFLISVKKKCMFFISWVFFFMIGFFPNHTYSSQGLENIELPTSTPEHLEQTQKSFNNSH